ncbi:cytochrome c [candidate division KSB1 bacterium]|nr:cytochrome c [candidate division KSB1 bacterium]
MKRILIPVFWAILLLIEATTIHRHIFSSDGEAGEQGGVLAAGSSESNQRLIFLLQYLAADYDRAVQNGQIIDSLEYGEMQRFSRDAARIYQSSTGVQQQTLNKLRQLEDLIAARAALPQIRKICEETTAILVKEKDLSVAPRRTPDLGYGKILFEENCASCHGLRGAGNGPAADTLNPRPRDFTDPERMNVLTPWQFYHAITFGVEGTAMPSFSEAWAPRPRWNLAFYLMTLRRDFQPVAPAASQKLTLPELATKNNIELAALIALQQRLPHADSSSYLKHVVDYHRQNPPELVMDDYITSTETGLKQSLAAYQRGDSAYAVQLAEEAYLEGFEMMEGELLRLPYLAFERAYAEFISCIEKKESPKKARTSIEAMLKILRQIRDHKGPRSAP